MSIVDALDAEPVYSSTEISSKAGEIWDRQNYDIGQANKVAYYATLQNAPMQPKTLNDVTPLPRTWSNSVAKPAWVDQFKADPAAPFGYDTIEMVNRPRTYTLQREDEESDTV